MAHFASVRWSRGLLAASALLLVGGCGRLGYGAVRGDAGAPDSGTGDSGTADSGSVDTGAGDSGSLDSGPPDGTVPVDAGVIDSSVAVDAVVPPLVIDVSSCSSTANVGVPYSCTPSVRPPLGGETFAWTFGPAHECSWLSVVPETGVVSATPGAGDVGSCGLALSVRSSLGPTDLAAVTINVTASMIDSFDIGAYHTCARSALGAVRCWGLNAFGQLGYDDTGRVSDGTVGRNLADMPEVPVGTTVRQISLGYYQTCALTTAGGVRCWGAGNFSRLGYAHGRNVGDGGTGGSIIANGDLPLGGPADEVATGGVGGCARLATGGVRCWGQNNGQDRRTEISGAAIASTGDVPIGVVDPIVDIAAGYDHYCVLTATGRVRCWGENWSGALGYDDTLYVGGGDAGRSIADMGDVNVGGTVVQISAGDATTCAVLDTGGLRCWGWNGEGQLGYGDTLDVGNGVPGRSIVDMGDVPVGGPVLMAWAGEQHTCAVLRTGAVRCWGGNAQGQLGYDDTVSVADGTAGRSIVDMGDVPLGGAATAVYTTAWDSGFTCARMATGGIRCWGNNGNGNCGYDDTIDIGDGAPGRSILDMGDVRVF